MVFENPERGLLTGALDLSPIQRWFFEQNLENLHHFNQSVLLKINTKASLYMIKAIFNVVVQYHDAFRLRFSADDHSQRYTDDISIAIEEKVLTLEEIPEDATKVQGELNIFNGPLLRIVVYRCPDNEDRLLIVAHHLIIDGVSWRILVDDLETIYGAFSASGRISLPAKTYSYRQWVEALKLYTKSPGFEKELVYWKGIEEVTEEICLKKESSSPGGYCLISLNEEESQKLLMYVPKKYNTQINDVLLTALTLAVGDICGCYGFSFTLEGHGREEVIGLDVSRTIGWFTSMFPVYLAISNPANLEKSINEVRNSLAEIPHKGVGYGIVKYYTEFLKKPLPRISFNYLGQTDAGVSNDCVFSYAKESSGEDGDKRNKDVNVININGWVRHSVLEIGFAYQPGFCITKNLAKQFKNRLIELIA